MWPSGIFRASQTPDVPRAQMTELCAGTIVAHEPGYGCSSGHGFDVMSIVWTTSCTGGRQHMGHRLVYLPSLRS
jgi:hypothetical protein